MKTKIYTTAIMLILSISVFAQNPNWSLYTTSNSPLTEDFVTSIQVDNHNKAWIGTYESGVVTFNGIEWVMMNSTNSTLSDNHIKFIEVDQSNKKWIGTESDGIFTIEDDPDSGSPVVVGYGKLSDYISVTDKTNGDIDNLTCLAFDNYGNEWFGTWGGGLVSFDGTNWVAYSISNSGIPHNTIYSVAVSPVSNVVWVGTLNRGLASFDGFNWTVYDTTNSDLPGNTVYGVAIDAAGNIWSGTENGLAKFDGTSWEVYDVTGTTSALNYNIVHDLKIDNEGKKWLCTDKGIGVFNDTVWSFIKASNSPILVNNMSTVAFDSRGNNWIGTLGSGFAVNNPEGITLNDDFLSFSGVRETIGMTVFPNPTRGGGTVTLEFGEIVDGKAEIFDAKGQSVKSLSTSDSNGSHSITFNTNDLVQGIYLVVFTDGKKIDTATLVIL
ncbi:MAG: T9SS type A sorting domain-containing protein [Bacteroidetes bacterium]|nr:T9SS type A sorting domain-containing protein [Bacteroidota bacterium]MBU1720002.1 T9SS type A sorting domain-containing protein [Bacteroidota bacterium]